MRGERSEIEEEGLLAVLLVDEPDCVVADQRRVVALLLEERAVPLPVDQAAPLAGEIVHLADDVAVEIVEATVLRPVFPVGMAEVPLADHQRLVARLLQRLRKRPLVRRQPIGVARKDDQRLQPIAHRVAAGHQFSARGRADRHAVEILEPDALGRELVDIGCPDLASAIAEVGVAEVVGHDEDDVGPWRLRARRRRGGCSGRHRREIVKARTLVMVMTTSTIL